MVGPRSDLDLLCEHLETRLSTVKEQQPITVSVWWRCPLNKHIKLCTLQVAQPLRHLRNNQIQVVAEQCLLLLGTDDALHILLRHTELLHQRLLERLVKVQDVQDNKRLGLRLHQLIDQQVQFIVVKFVKRLENVPVWRTVLRKMVSHHQQLIEHPVHVVQHLKPLVALVRLSDLNEHVLDRLPQLVREERLVSSDVRSRGNGPVDYLSV